MAMRVATDRAVTVEELTPDWLTAVLRRKRVLPAGRVVSIDKHSNSAFNSHTLHLRPVYSAEAPPAAPTALILKCNIPQAWAKRAGAREVAFYQMVQTLPDHPLVIVRCYDAICDVAPGGEIGDSHILLEDLSDSHVVPGPRDKQITLVDNLPTDAHLKQAIDALARFHAYWWQHPLLGIGAARLGTWCSDEEHFASETTRRRHAWDDLIANEKEGLPSQVISIYERILDQLPHLWQRYFQPRLATFKHLTLTHGDSYLTNFLCPRLGRKGNSYIIDWQGPEVYLGASDLVTMCATFWTREQRAEGEREVNVLCQYHRTLQENGVTGYAWEELVRDYQYSLVDWLLVPLQDRLDGSGREYWWPKMQCLAHAFEDWQVADLFTDL